MKLYTEEHVREAISIAKDGELIANDIINRLTPIELPSDSLIEYKLILEDVVRKEGYCHCFLEGAKWMRDKILNKGGESATVKNK